MTQQIVGRNIEVVSEHIATEARDIDTALALYTDDIVWESPARNLRFVGKRDVAENYRRMFASMTEIQVHPIDRFGAGDRVIDDCVVEFKLVSDGFANARAPVGTHVSLRLLHIFTLRDGKIARESVYEIWPEANGAA